MGEFVRILKVSKNVIVSVQLLQTMSIMIQNLKSDHSICKIWLYCNDTSHKYVVTPTYREKYEKCITFIKLMCKFCELCNSFIKVVHQCPSHSFSLFKTSLYCMCVCVGGHAFVWSIMFLKVFYLLFVSNLNMLMENMQIICSVMNI